MDRDNNSSPTTNERPDTLTGRLYDGTPSETSVGDTERKSGDGDNAPSPYLGPATPEPTPRAYVTKPRGPLTEREQAIVRGIEIFNDWIAW